MCQLCGGTTGNILKLGVIDYRSDDFIVSSLDELPATNLDKFNVYEVVQLRHLNNKKPHLRSCAMRTGLIQTDQNLSKFIGRAPFKTTGFGDWTISVYGDRTLGTTHYVLTYGNLEENPFTEDEEVVVRIHSACWTGEKIEATNCDCKEQLAFAMSKIQERGRGVIIYLDQEGRGNGIHGKMWQLDAMFDFEGDRIVPKYKNGGAVDTVEAFRMHGYPAECRNFSIAAEILDELGIKRVILLSNNPLKITQASKKGVTVRAAEIYVGKGKNAITDNDLASKQELGYMTAEIEGRTREVDAYGLYFYFQDELQNSNTLDMLAEIESLYENTEPASFQNIKSADKIHKHDWLNTVAFSDMIAKYFQSTQKDQFVSEGVAPIPTAHGDWTKCVLLDYTTGLHHDILFYGDIRHGKYAVDEHIPVYVNSGDILTDILHLDGEENSTLYKVMDAMHEYKRGIIICLNQTAYGNGSFGTIDHLQRHYEWQGGQIVRKTTKVHTEDNRRYDIVSQFLARVGIYKICLIDEGDQSVIDAVVEKCKGFDFTVKNLSKALS